MDLVKFNISFFKSREYPTNLLSVDECSHTVRELYQQLKDSSSRLFCLERDALVDCLELERHGSSKCQAALDFSETGLKVLTHQHLAFCSKELHSEDEMRTQLRMPNQGMEDPICRYL
jgi:hypothetical protein